MDCCRRIISDFCDSSRFQMPILWKIVAKHRFLWGTSPESQEAAPAAAPVAAKRKREVEEPLNCKYGEMVSLTLVWQFSGYESSLLKRMIFHESWITSSTYDFPTFPWAGLRANQKRRRWESRELCSGTFWHPVIPSTTHNASCDQ